MSVLDHSKRYAYYFEQICAIPHGSFNEQAISNYLVSFAKQQGLECYQDEALNVTIKKTAAKGCELAPPILLQGHIDMVCEKTPDSNHNFETDSLSLRVEDGWLYADRTTLGADDGIAVAYMLALLEDDTLKAPALECVFTAAEEVGLVGALAFKGEHLSARRMICLDGGGEVTTMVTTAGGMRADITLPITHQPCSKDGVRITVSGLMGGHSGADIDTGRGNANKIMGRLLYPLVDEICLSMIEGGSKDNAIPRDAQAIVVGDMATIKDSVEVMTDAIKKEIGFVETNFEVKVEPTTVTSCLGVESTKKIIALLNALPNGVLERSMEIENFVVSSLNLGVMSTKQSEWVLHASIRSAYESMMDSTANTLTLIATAYHAFIKLYARYPGWAFERVSPLRDLYAITYQQLYHQDIIMQTMHAGTECGVFKALFNDMDIITMGPIAEMIHTPQERLNLASFDRTYLVLKTMIETCGKDV